jgi:methylmalonyl-CoA mutase cobalamin-binding subunit
MVFIGPLPNNGSTCHNIKQKVERTPLNNFGHEISVLPGTSPFYALHEKNAEQTVLCIAIAFVNKPHRDAMEQLL